MTAIFSIKSKFHLAPGLFLLKNKMSLEVLYQLTSAYGDVERIVNVFKELKKNNQNKDVVVYCYSIPCMTGRKIGKMLAEKGVYVKHLGIGWNEWRYYWNLWNHEHEWNKTNVMNYVTNGKSPGNPILKINSTSCKIEGQFGC